MKQQKTAFPKHATIINKALIVFHKIALWEAKHHITAAELVLSCTIYIVTIICYKFCPFLCLIVQSDRSEF